jgi:hypothetical protein
MIGRRLSTLILTILAAAPAHAQVVQPNFWGTNGEVTSIARVGNIIYLAGSFSNVGPATGGAVPIDRRSGAPWPRFPRVNGIVHAVVSDGSGGWFVGGDFTAVEGEPHHNVAHLRADGTVDPWDPGVEDVEYVITSGMVNPIHTVSALALDGDMLYIGGRFEVVGGQPHQAIVAVNASTGAVSPWNPHADGMVTALVADRGMLFVGGSFSAMAGQPRSRLAAFRLADGSLTAWNPAADGTVLTIALARNLAWIGGEFDHVGGEPRNSLAAVTLGTGAVTPWDAGLLPLRRYIAHGSWIWPYVSSIVVRGNTLFAGGSFDVAGGASRYTVAELDLGTARATSFDARIGAGLTKALAMHGQTLYVGGYLYDFGGHGRPNLAAVDVRTGVASSWNPRADGIVLTLAAAGSTVFAGGQFTSMGDWQPRAGLAALDATTGRALSWSPTLDLPYFVTLVSGGERVYASGRFTSVDGQVRGHFAAFDGATGALTDWNPWTVGVTELDAGLTRMTTIGDTVYVATPIHEFNGVPRHNLFALDGRTGALLPWAPNPRGRFKSGQVGAMSAFGNTLFVAGEFDTVGGAPRPWLAQLDGTTGLATSWIPNPGLLGSIRNFYPHSIRSDGEATFVGGWFYDLSDHWGLLAFDSSGSLLDWVPSLKPEYHALIVGRQPAANALAVHGSTLFVGGRFDTIAAEPHANLGAIDATTGAVLPWNPDVRGGFSHPFDVVSALTLADDVLYVGGRFTRLGGYPSRGFAALALAPRGVWGQGRHGPGAEGGVPFALAPNPTRGSTRLAFSLSAPATVSLGVFDVAGRRVATPLDRSLQRAGEHTLSLDTMRLRAGVYYCRLDAGGVATTRRFVVLE